MAQLSEARVRRARLLEWPRSNGQLPSDVQSIDGRSVQEVWCGSGRRRNRDNWHFRIRDRQCSQLRVGILTFGPPRGWARRHELTVDWIIALAFWGLAS
jgi:hypothetical protein